MNTNNLSYYSLRLLRMAKPKNTSAFFPNIFLFTGLQGYGFNCGRENRSKSQVIVVVMVVAILGKPSGCWITMVESCCGWNSKDCHLISVSLGQFLQSLGYKETNLCAHLSPVIDWSATITTTLLISFNLLINSDLIFSGCMSSGAHLHQVFSTLNRPNS